MFNLPSRLNILDNHGILLIKRAVDAIHEIKIFLLYDFYVEVYYNRKRRKALKAEPLWSDRMFNFFLETID